DDVYTDAKRRKVERNTARQADHGVLGRNVGQTVRQALNPRRRGDVDDRALPARSGGGAGKGLAGIDRAFEIDGEVALPERPVKIEDRPDAADAGTVDKPVH